MQSALAKALVVAAVAVTASTASAEAASPSRSTPLQSTLGWFRAINAHDRQRALSYVQPVRRSLMGWDEPQTVWSRFTDLRCRLRSHDTPRSADVRCTFHESASPTEGNPDSFWDVLLLRIHGGWLIHSYSQG